jgi:hypothetical protein
MNLPWYQRKIVHFSLVHSPSRPKTSTRKTLRNLLSSSLYMIDLTALNSHVNAKVDPHGLTLLVQPLCGLSYAPFLITYLG